MKTKLVDGIQVRQVLDCPTYWVSSNGAVWSDEKIQTYLDSGIRVIRRRKGRWLKPVFGTDDYLFVSIYGSSGRINISIHRLVAICWIGERPADKPSVLHSNDVKLDNCVLNLRYGTAQDNSRDQAKNGSAANTRGQINGRAKFTSFQIFLIRSRRAHGERGCVLAKEYEVCEDTISRICTKKTYA